MLSVSSRLRAESNREKLKLSVDGMAERSDMVSRSKTGFTAWILSVVSFSDLLPLFPFVFILSLDFSYREFSKPPATAKRKTESIKKMTDFRFTAAKLRFLYEE
jgi:hypothetical protein